DLDVVADLDIAQHFGSGPYDDVVAQRGMAFAALIAGAAEGDSLVEQDVVADFGGFADDDAGAVIDEEAPAYGGAGVNLDSGEESADLGDDAGNERHAPDIELMREAVSQNGMEPRVTEKDLEHAFGCRVLPEDRVDLFPDGSKHL